jgi:hypothetical protein
MAELQGTCRESPMSTERSAIKSSCDKNGQ